MKHLTDNVFERITIFVDMVMRYNSGYFFTICQMQTKSELSYEIFTMEKINEAIIAKV
jgi:hypothetical protein